jgi:hypothetical protein
MPKMSDNKIHNILSHRNCSEFETDQTLGFALKINNRHLLDLVTNFITNGHLRKEIILKLKERNEKSRMTADYFVLHYYVIQSIQNGILAPYPLTSKYVLVALLLSLLVDYHDSKNVCSVIQMGLKFADEKERRINALSRSLVLTNTLLDCTVNTAHKNNSIKVIQDQILMYTDKFVKWLTQDKDQKARQFISGGSFIHDEILHPPRNLDNIDKSLLATLSYP